MVNVVLYSEIQILKNFKARFAQVLEYFFHTLISSLRNFINKKIEGNYFDPKARNS